MSSLSLKSKFAFSVLSLLLWFHLRTSKTIGTTLKRHMAEIAMTAPVANLSLLLLFAEFIGYASSRKKGIHFFSQKSEMVICFWGMLLGLDVQPLD